ncbi:hypothetical protein LV469_08085 [Peptoniphilus sp. GNH]|nr:hypothetical protein LV469_08085 [Peptoniphilus sp. GNH]
MKKLSISLAALLLFSSFTYTKVQASQKQESPLKSSSAKNDARLNEKNIVRLKNLFAISNSYDGFDYSSFSENDELNLSYSWSNTKTDDNIYIRTDGKGNIIYANINENIHKKEKEEQAIKLVSKESLIKLADKWVKKLLTDGSSYTLKEARLDKDPFAYKLIYQRSVGGIDVLGDTLNLSFDKNLDLKFFSRESQSLKYPDSSFSEKNKISREEAIRLFKEKRPLLAGYKELYSSKKVNLEDVISIEDEALFLDAINKKFFLPDSSLKYSYFSNDEKAKEARDSGLSPFEKRELESYSKLKSFEEASKKAEKLFNLHNPSSKGLIKEADGSYTWNFSYDKNNAYLSLDAENLNLVAFSNPNTSQQASKKVLSEEKAIEIAKKFIKEKTPELSCDFNPNRAIVHSRKDAYDISFNLYIKNRPVFDKSISLSIDRKNAKVTDFNKNYKHIQAPASTISANIKAAEQKLYSENSFKNYYIYDQNKIRLIYSFENLNPIFKSDGSKYFENFTSEFEYENIDDSKYKDEISILKDYSIGINKKVLTDEISRSDLFKLIYPESTFRDLSYYREKYGYSDKEMGESLKIKEALKILANETFFNYSNELSPEIFDKKLFKNSKYLDKDDITQVYFSYSYKIFEDRATDFNKNLSTEEALHYFYNLIINLN